MKNANPPWDHEHTFNQDQKRPGEKRTIMVITITGLMMIIEIATGIMFGSMALLADGLHMASHTAALSINVFAYIYARAHAHNRSYSFGTGKVNALGGFTGAILLVLFAIIMAWESMERLVYPVSIAFNQAIFVAFLGLIVNGVSVLLLGDSAGTDVSHDHEHHRDHNLRSAYLHVLADALTSVLAIVALLTAKYLGLVWMDPLMGIVGAILVCRWSIGLLRSTSVILLDKQGPQAIQETIKQNIEGSGTDAIVDLHCWSIGPGIYSLVLSIVSENPMKPEYYKSRISSIPGLVHITIEVHKCKDNKESDMHQTTHD